MSEQQPKTLVEQLKFYIFSSIGRVKYKSWSRFSGYAPAELRYFKN